MKVVFKDGIWVPKRGLLRFLFAFGFAVLGPFGFWLSGVDIFTRNPNAAAAVGAFVALFFFGMILSTMIFDD